MNSQSHTNPEKENIDDYNNQKDVAREGKKQTNSRCRTRTKDNTELK